MMISSSKKHYSFLSAFAYLAAALFFSCSQEVTEETVPELSKPSMQIMLQLPGEDPDTRATETGNPDENLVRSIYLFMFDSSGNKEFDIYMDVPYTGSSSEVDMSLWNSEKVIIVLNTDVLSSLNAPRNIHVVTNVAQAKLSGVTDETSLKAILTNTITSEIPQPGVSNPLVMHGMCQAHVFTSNVRATLSLVRNVSKVRLTVNASDSNVGGNTITFAPGNSIAMTAADVADRSYLIAGAGVNPPGITHIEYAAKTLPLSSSGSGTKTFFLSALYINENLTDTPTYLLIRVPYHNGSETITDNYYKIRVNEDNLTVTRNTIYDLTVNINALGSESLQTAPVLSATVQILPWDEKTLISDLTQTCLTVESTKLQVTGGVYNFGYSTNAEVSKRTVASSDASWLNAVLDGGNDNNLKITASGVGYTAPRTGMISIRVNDLTKVITVTQEAVPVSDGSISLNPQVLYLSVPHPSRTAALNIAGGASWSNLINNPAIATYSPASGTGNAILNFTRGATAANADFRFVNLNTLQYADVKVCNLSLTSSVTEIQVPGTGVTNETETGIVALGGDAQWVVDSKPAWVTVSNSNGDLLYSADAEPNEADRNGIIVLRHVNDPDLKVSIAIKQSAHYIKFPEFMYLVVRYRVGTNPQPISGTGWDMDSATYFQGTGISALDHYGVGYGTTGSSGTVATVSYSSVVVMQFGGDNTTSGYETTYVNFKNLLDLTYDLLPRYIRVELYARWWNKNYNGTTNINIDVVLYNAGTMTPSGYDFVNSLGSSAEVLSQTYTVELKTTNTTTPIAPDNYDKSQHLGTITYDKLKNLAVFTLLPAPAFMPMSSDTHHIEALPGESKDDYSKRVNEYYKNK